MWSEVTDGWLDPEKGFDLVMKHIIAATLSKRQKEMEKRKQDEVETQEKGKTTNGGKKRNGIGTAKAGPPTTTVNLDPAFLQTAGLQALLITRLRTQTSNRLSLTKKKRQTGK